MAYHGEQPLLTAPDSDHTACRQQIADLEARVTALTDAVNYWSGVAQHEIKVRQTKIAALERTQADVAVLRAAQNWR